MCFGIQSFFEYYEVNAVRMPFIKTFPEVSATAPPPTPNHTHQCFCSEFMKTQMTSLQLQSSVFLGFPVYFKFCAQDTMTLYNTTAKMMAEL